MNTKQSSANDLRCSSAEKLMCKSKRPAFTKNEADVLVRAVGRLLAESPAGKALRATLLADQLPIESDQGTNK